MMFWQHDAACRVIARLKKERDEARQLLTQAEREIPMTAATATAVNTPTLSNGKRGYQLTLQNLFLCSFYLCMLIHVIYLCL